MPTRLLRKGACRPRHGHSGAARHVCPHGDVRIADESNDRAIEANARDNVGDYTGVTPPFGFSGRDNRR